MAKKKSKKSAKLVFIVDRSGSMSGLVSDMEGAMKEILKTQKDEYKGDMLVTLVRFDDDIEEVFSNKPIKEVDKIKLQPRGCTALLDAIGRTVNKVERNFIETEEKKRPERVLFIIITDGYENASQEFTKAKIFEMIEKAKRDRNWDFTFVGANQDAISEGGSIGIRADKSIDYAATAGGVRNMAMAVGKYTTSYFTKGKASYSDKDKKDAMKDND